MAESINLFLPNGEAEYFCKEGWTAESTNCPSGKSPDRAVQPAAWKFQVFSSASSTFMMQRLKSAKVGAAGTRPLCVCVCSRAARPRSQPDPLGRVICKSNDTLGRRRRRVFARMGCSPWFGMFMETGGHLRSRTCQAVLRNGKFACIEGVLDWSSYFEEFS